MKNEQKSTAAGKNTELADSEFEGYTLEELRYQRALLALKKDFCKARVLNKVEALRSRSIFSKSKHSSSKLSMAGSVTKKVFNSLNYIDYAILGVSAYGSVRKLFKLFRKRK